MLIFSIIYKESDIYWALRLSSKILIHYKCFVFFEPMLFILATFLKCPFTFYKLVSLSSSLSLNGRSCGRERRAPRQLRYGVVRPGWELGMAQGSPEGSLVAWP